MTILRPHPDGAILFVRALPGSRENTVRGIQDGSLKIAVTQSPEKGKANKAIRDLLAKRLKVRKGQIVLLSGFTSTAKEFLIRDVDVTELQSRISDLIG